MRHVLAAGSVPPRTRGMRKAARPTILIALARRSYRLPAPGLRARRSAIHVAPVAATAQHHLRATPPAQKHPSRLVHPRPRPQPKCDGHQERWMQYSTAHRGASRLPGVGRGDGTYFPVGPSSRLFYFGAAIIGRASPQGGRSRAHPLIASTAHAPFNATAERCSHARINRRDPPAIRLWELRDPHSAANVRGFWQPSTQVVHCRNIVKACRNRNRHCAVRYRVPARASPPAFARESPLCPS